MQFAQFATLEEAKQFRSNHGGWIMIGEMHHELPNTDYIFWFHISYTPTKIFNHPVLKHCHFLSSKLI